MTPGGPPFQLQSTSLLSELPTHLSLVGTHLAGQMQESITVSAQVPTVSTQNDGRGDAVIMVITGGLQTQGGYVS